MQITAQLTSLIIGIFVLSIYKFDPIVAPRPPIDFLGQAPCGNDESLTTKSHRKCLESIDLTPAFYYFHLSTDIPLRNWTEILKNGYSTHCKDRITKSRCTQKYFNIISESCQTTEDHGASFDDLSLSIKVMMGLWDGFCSDNFARRHIAFLQKGGFSCFKEPSNHADTLANEKFSLCVRAYNLEKYEDLKRWASSGGLNKCITESFKIEGCDPRAIKEPFGINY